jgi:hypothetical protein
LNFDDPMGSSINLRGSDGAGLSVKRNGSSSKRKGSNIGPGLTSSLDLTGVKDSPLAGCIDLGGGKGG